MSPPGLRRHRLPTVKPVPQSAQANARQENTAAHGVLAAENADLSSRDLDPHPFKRAEEGDERLRIVGGEDSTHLQVPQRWRNDLDRRRRVAIELAGNALERLVLKHDLVAEPGRRALCV